MIALIVTIATWALALTIKGGFLGRLFTNWDRFTQKKEAKLEETLAAIKKAWKDKAYDKLAKNIARVPYDAFLKWFFDGSIIGGVIVLVWAYFAGFHFWDIAAVALAWLCLLMSMGEEAGSIGDYKGWWGDYKDAVDAAGSPYFTRSYGIKKGIQYGAMAGAALALAIGSWLPLFAGAAMPLVYFAGNSLRLAVKGQRGWSWSEPLWGAVLGAALGYGLSGVFALCHVVFLR